MFLQIQMRWEMLLPLVQWLILLLLLLWLMRRLLLLRLRRLLLWCRLLRLLLMIIPRWWPLRLRRHLQQRRRRRLLPGQPLLGLQRHLLQLHLMRLMKWRRRRSRLREELLHVLLQLSPRFPLGLRNTRTRTCRRPRNARTSWHSSIGMHGFSGPGGHRLGQSP
jgi:hypothetical protein